MNNFNYSGRIERLLGLFGRLKLDGMLVHSPENVRYFSGFSGSHGRLIISDTVRILFTDQRYTEQAGIESPGWEIVNCGIDRSGDLIRTIDASGIRRLGFEAEGLTVVEHTEMTKNLKNVDLIPTTDLCVTLRAVKDHGEIDRITRALGIAEDAFSDLLKELKPGMTERDAAALLEYLMYRHGSEGPAFDTIAARGNNTSRPHHSPCGDVLGRPDALLLDFGAKVCGYASDITRMVFIDREPEGFKALREATERALEAVTTAIKPGMTGAEADGIAREVYAGLGMEENTLRGLGHGVGLAIHEWPRLVLNNDMVLQPGMICTLEPGVYLPGTAGVRIEDMVLITDSGARVLNTSPWTVTVELSDG